MQQHYIYILASKRNGTLYIGVTKDLKRRVWEHKNKQVEGFTEKYGVDLLVHYEIYDDYWIAANREKNMKDWKRAWKMKLIETTNPEWKDLYNDI